MQYTYREKTRLYPSTTMYINKYIELNSQVKAFRHNCHFHLSLPFPKDFTLMLSRVQCIITIDVQKCKCTCMSGTKAKET